MGEQIGGQILRLIMNDFRMIETLPMSDAFITIGIKD